MSEQKPQKILVHNYSIAPALLEYKLYQVFGVIENDAQQHVFNDVMQDIETMIGGSIKTLAEEVARLIIETGKMDLRKNGTGDRK